MMPSMFCLGCKHLFYDSCYLQFHGKFCTNNTEKMKEVKNYYKPKKEKGKGE